MRIINGKFKGRRFSPPTNITARPTTDFAKEGLFNVLANHYLEFENCRALDLFAGTGSISVELISRGCPSVVAVEMSQCQLSFIHSLAEKLEIKNLKIFKMDVFRFLKNSNEKFNFIFADPPYQLPNLKTLPDLVFSASMLAENGVFVLEHGANNNFQNHEHFLEEKNYGNVHFSFFR